ncbi:MAG: short-chain dehydrogenase [Cycloclasticus sp.]|nr:MAG: short-chain dehydrogenase [Cycloclasticus sp.]
MNNKVPTSTQTLKGRVYLITGASGGLGHTTSLAMAKYGATVILTGRNEKKLDALYDQIEEAGYPTPAIIPFDLMQTDEDIYKQFIQSIYNEFKQLNGLVNLACYMGIVGPLGSQEHSEWQKVMQVNVNASALMSKVCLPLLQQSEQASITFISDSSARQSNAYWGAYGVSKVAVESFSNILADELEETSVVSNVFIPGPCILPLRKKTHPGEEDLGLNTAEEVAESLVISVLNNNFDTHLTH